MNRTPTRADQYERELEKHEPTAPISVIVAPAGSLMYRAIVKRGKRTLYVTPNADTRTDARRLAQRFVQELKP